MQIISRAEAKEQGSKHYFTGKPCPNGHIAERFVSSFGCTVCAKAHYDERRKKHPEKYAEASRRYRNNNPEKVRESVKRWKKRNPEKVKEIKREEAKRNRKTYAEAAKRRRRENHQAHLERQAAYREKNRDRIREYFREWRKNNPDKTTEYRQLWLERNPGIVSEIHKRRMNSDPGYKAARSIRGVLNRTLRLLKKGKTESTERTLGYSISEFKEHVERNMTSDMTWENHGEVWHLDHVIPVADFIKAGIDDPKIVNALSNLMPIDAEENLSKGAGFALSPPPVL